MRPSEPALPTSFYARDAETVAKALLGKTLVFGNKRVRIVETEAYVGTHDLACHASKGRTARTDVLFGPPGRAYLYLIYGMYELFNVVTGSDGDAQGVLVRAAEPLSGATDAAVVGQAVVGQAVVSQAVVGETLMGKTDGPGKLTRALGLTRAYNRHDLTAAPLTLSEGPPPPTFVATTRVGVDYAGAWKDAPLRFYDPQSRWVSKR